MNKPIPKVERLAVLLKYDPASLSEDQRFVLLLWFNTTDSKDRLKRFGMATEWEQAEDQLGEEGIQLLARKHAEYLLPLLVERLRKHQPVGRVDFCLEGMFGLAAAAGILLTAHANLQELASLR